MNSKHSRTAAFLGLHVVCCGGLLLVTTGVLSLGSIIAWLGSGPVQSAGLVLIGAAVAGLVWWRERRTGRLRGASCRRDARLRGASHVDDA